MRDSRQVNHGKRKFGEKIVWLWLNESCGPDEARSRLGPSRRTGRSLHVEGKREQLGRPSGFQEQRSYSVEYVHLLLMWKHGVELKFRAMKRVRSEARDWMDFFECESRCF